MRKEGGGGGGRAGELIQSQEGGTEREKRGRMRHQLLTILLTTRERCAPELTFDLCPGRNREVADERLAGFIGKEKNLLPAAAPPALHSSRRSMEGEGCRWQQLGAGLKKNSATMKQTYLYSFQ